MQELRAQDGASALLRDDGEILELRDPQGRLIIEYDTRESRAIFYFPEAQLRVRSADGKVEFSSDQGMKFATKGALELEAKRLDARIGETDFRGERIVARATEVRVAWGKLEQVVGRLFTFAKNVYERVEGLLHSRAGRVRAESKGSYLVQAERVTVAAQDDVKLQGKVINVG